MSTTLFTFLWRYVLRVYVISFNANFQFLSKFIKLYHSLSSSASSPSSKPCRWLYKSLDMTFVNSNRCGFPFTKNLDVALNLSLSCRYLVYWCRTLLNLTSDRKFQSPSSGSLWILTKHEKIHVSSTAIPSSISIFDFFVYSDCSCNKLTTGVLPPWRWLVD